MLCSAAQGSASGGGGSGGTGGFTVRVRRWHAVGVWNWNAGDDVCGICRLAFEACAPGEKFPGDDSPVVWGKCGHAFHLQCITKWLGAQGAEQPKCPICRYVMSALLECSQRARAERAAPSPPLAADRAACLAAR